MENNGILSAWRKGDLVELKGEKFRLTSEGYEKDGKIVCDTDKGDTVSYLKLIEKAKLLETASGRKNITIK